jgi:hypothetical protein
MESNMDTNDPVAEFVVKYKYPSDTNEFLGRIINPKTTSLKEGDLLYKAPVPVLPVQDDILRDAKRYRWLRDSDNFPMDDIPDDSIWDHLCEKDRADFDSFIDLMMSNKSFGAAELLMLSADQSEAKQS